MGFKLKSWYSFFPLKAHFHTQCFNVSMKPDRSITITVHTAMRNNVNAGSIS